MMDCETVCKSSYEMLEQVRHKNFYPFNIKNFLPPCGDEKL